MERVGKLGPQWSFEGEVVSVKLSLMVLVQGKVERSCRRDDDDDDEEDDDDEGREDEV